MAQINLLKQNAHSYGQLLESGPKILVWLFGLVFLGLLAYYAWLFVDSGQIAAQTAKTQSQLASDNQQVSAAPGRDELLTRQQQLKELSGLVSAHVYWSQLFPALAKVTLKTASYDSVQIVQGGGVTLGVTVPTLDDFDKYLQAFDLPEVYKDFNNLRVDGYSKIQTKSSVSARFQVKMDYDPSLLKYQPAPDASGIQ